MKITPNKLLKTTFSKLKFHEEKQFLQQCGTNLSIRSLIDSKSLQPDFITIGQSTPFIVQPINPDETIQTTAVKLYDYVSSNSHKSIFTAECIQNNRTLNKTIEICSYSLRELNNESMTGAGYRAERKSFKISEIPGYVSEENIENVYFVPEHYNHGWVYVITKTRGLQCDCITLVDMFKLKLLAHGFIPSFEYACVSQYEEGEISILGKNCLKRVKLQQKEQSFSINEEKLPKKFQLSNVNIIKHHWLGYHKLLLATTKSIYITEGQNNDIVSTISVLEEDCQETKIFEILVLNKSILVFLENLDILVYNEDGEDSSNKYELAEIASMNKFFEIPQENTGLTFVQVEITKNLEELMVGLSNGQYYYSKYEQLELGSEQNHFSFEKIPFKFYEPKQGEVFAATGQNFCLITTDNAIEIWDLQKISLVNRMEFQIPGTNKSVYKCALNPDGHSICVVFPDRIRFYRILINKFKQYSEIYINKCRVVQYCHGGQMVACTSSRTNGSYVTIFDTMKFKEICSFKVSHIPKQIVWNEHDDTLFVSIQKLHIVNIFKIANRSKQESESLSGPSQMMRYDYASKNLVITLENGSVLTVNAEGEVNKLDIKIQGIYSVFPSEGMYFASTKFGKLYYSPHISFQKRYELSIFQTAFKMHYRKGCLIAYTNVSNILLLKVKLPEINEAQIVKQPDVEDIMLVEKEQIVKLFEKTKYLESQFEQLQNLTTVKLDEQRKKYNESLDLLSNRFQDEVKEIKKQNTDLQVESTKNHKTSQRMFDELETGQIRSVNELEKVYDLKIKLQKEKYLALEQQNMEQKMRYETMISKIENSYHNDIEKVRKQYASKLEQKSKEIDAQRAINMGFKKKLQTKLIDLEEENELTLFELQNKKDTNIKNLIEKNTKLEREYDSVMIELHNMKEEYDELKKQNERNKQKLKRNERSVTENFNRVVVLEKQLSNRNKMIEEKNTTIEQQLHQISQLQKSKYVLTFRTFQIRKTLEPKDELIEKLKSNLLKLEEESKEEKKSKFEIEQTAEKYMKILHSLRKENEELKIAHKNIVMVHRNLCSDIYMVMNNIDSKDRNTHFVEIYQKYVKEENVNSRANSTFKSDPTSEQINRHLIHVQQSLQQVAQGNEKMLDGKKKEVEKKMKENAELLYEINVMRKKLREYEKKLEDKEIEIAKLVRENKETKELHKSTRANTAQTGFTRRLISRDPNTNRNNDLLDLSVRRQSDYLLPDRKGGRNRIVSANRTTLLREESRKDKSKLSDIARQLQTAKNTVRRQEKMIQQLNARLFSMPQVQVE